MAYHNELGKLGEQLATEYLVRNGYSILERNFVYDRAEIDIIANHENTIIVVEVKTRNSLAFGDPQEFISKKKIKSLMKATNEYLISNAIEMEVRFDIIAVLKNKKIEQIEHFKNAFYHF